jgi:transcriptional regulator with XRE-family HTH domain
MTKYNNEVFSEVISLRKRGFTYSEIAKVCNISRSTVRNWLKNEIFSQEISVRNVKKAINDNKKRLLVINKARKTERNRQITEILHTTDIEYKHFRHNPLFIAGLSIYLSEGDLGDKYHIRLSSTRPELQSIFIKFLMDFMGIDKYTIRIWLLLYPTMDEVECMKYWIKKTGLTAAQFHKNQFIRYRGEKSVSHNGVANILIGNTIKKRKLLKWLLTLQRDIKSN